MSSQSHGFQLRCAHLKVNGSVSALTRCFDALFRILRDRAAGSAEREPHADGARAVDENERVLLRLDIAKNELSEDLRRLAEHILFVMPPAIAILRADEFPDRLPVALFHRFQEVPLMQPHLPRGLPEQREIDREGERGEARNEAQIFSIHPHE